MKEELLKTLLDLRIAIGELQAAMTDVERAARELSAILLECHKEQVERDKQQNEPS